MDSVLPKIAISMGDPAGIGPEIIIKVLLDAEIRSACIPVIIGDRNVLTETLDFLSLDLEIAEARDADEFNGGGDVFLLSVTELKDIEKGRVSEEAGHASGLYIEKAVDLTIRGITDAIVTAPINKESFNRGGFPYPGHTEFLAHLTNTSNYAMMLMGERLRVILLTIHCPLMEILKCMSRDETLRITRLAHRSLRDYFGIARPRLALAAINPHAGEGGLFGKEEAGILIPAVEMARGEGIDVSYPLPPDTLFYSAAKGNYDAVICSYHDQGLIPLKLLHFEDGVNVTLGLPVIRTSPDHGTAFDIVGKGIASAESMKAALKTALHMINAKKRMQKN